MKLRSSTRKRHSEETPVKTKKGKPRGRKEAGEDKKKDPSDDALNVEEVAAMMPMPMAIDSPAFSTNASLGSYVDAKSLAPAYEDDEEEMELILELCMADERVVKTLEYTEQQDEERNQTIRPSLKQPILVRTKTSTTPFAFAMIGHRDEDENSPVTIDKNQTPAEDYEKDNKLGMEWQVNSSVQNNENITTQEEDRLLADFLSTAAAHELPPLDHEDDDEEEPELGCHSNNNNKGIGNTSSPAFSPAYHPVFHHCLPESTVSVGTHEHSAFAAYTRPQPPPIPPHATTTMIASTTTTVYACQRCEEFWTDYRKANHILFKHKKLLDESANDALYGWRENGQSFDLLDHPQTDAILTEIIGRDSETKALRRFCGRLCT
jgi:hypothetical protein